MFIWYLPALVSFAWKATLEAKHPLPSDTATSLLFAAARVAIWVIYWAHLVFILQVDKCRAGADRHLNLFQAEGYLPPPEPEAVFS